MKKIPNIFLLLFLTIFTGQQLAAAPVILENRQKENLGRGMVAYRTVVGSSYYVCVTWRYFSTDDINKQFNVYKATYNVETGETGSLQKINSLPIGNSTFYKYRETGLTAFKYYLREVVDDTETEENIAECFLPNAAAASAGNIYNYIQIPMKQIEGDDEWKYEPNDAVVADLDGDGEFEIVIHRARDGQDNANNGITMPPVLQAYKLDGTFLWEINLGKNIREGAHYTQFLVYDLDGDGKAEVVCKTAEGSIDGLGNYVGETYFPEYCELYGFDREFNPDADYINYNLRRNSDGTYSPNGRIMEGPEFLTVFSGETGAEIFTTAYDPPRYFTKTGSDGVPIPVLEPTTSQISSMWGDDYGNRMDRFLACVAFLDGEKPSIVMCRGYYTRTFLVAYDFKDGKLEHKWRFDSRSFSNYSDYEYQGDHSVRVADVDGDGKDDIIFGSMTIGSNGKPIYSTKKGHGDAQHVGDLIPDQPGLEILQVHENKKDGTSVWDAKTGEIIYNIPSSDDVGRGMTADIDPYHRGQEFWSSRSGGVRSSATGEVITSSTSGVSMNMACWWDGDLLRELQDGTGITKFNYASYNAISLFSPTGVQSNNSTKANPCLVADILGDWREELILRTTSNKYIRIYFTDYETDYRFHTFLEDPVYRMSVVYQNVAYNQPTNTGFYIGPDLENIFVEKNIITNEDSYTFDPVFDGISYNWYVGDRNESTKQLTLNKSDFELNTEIPVTFELNFRGHMFTDELTITFADNVSINGEVIESESSLVKLVQTLVNDELLLDIVSPGQYNARIVSTSGIIYKNIKFNTSGGRESIDVAALPQGIYILSVVYDSKAYNVRFIKK